tara:strand:+ start:1698 stop:2648 length:951 start_codon:yes stop_codon:yes gene_type:complete
MNRNHLEDTLIVTGAGGFLGKAFMNLLDKSKFKEVKTLRSKDYDLRDPKQAYNAIKGANLVVHIAGVTGGIDWIKKHPGNSFYDNIMMNTNVLHSAMQHKVKRVVAIGSVCSYPKITEIPFKEENLWEGHPEEINAPYGFAKRMAVVQSEAYYKQYGLRSQVLLLTNMYGPQDTFDLNRSHVVPALIVRFNEAIEKGLSKVTLWGDGTPTRDFFYVKDAAQAILDSLNSKSLIPINIGSGKETSIKELAETIKKLTGGNFDIEWDTSKPNGQPRRILDITKAKTEIGFNPRYTLEEGLRETIRWYIENKKEADKRI